ncbi:MULTISPECIES: DUF427 domain-containing protein [unclassified Frondihabitans]|uniref:DUF427 domain-containing protein n=1 Tax=unclassified Frondihabitans TaxID=2626248 RepID=UPI0007021035|nr:MULTISPECIES: DUF427 domain-containing protein [unclassified Frondihabitans]KQQ27304.1 hypothetical protein ASF54_00280 [Frondihabitans sp. Leaf304]MBF4577768.1 DUF427 domain-containing protein [Frondihabitans sp. VKM Ac-2883]
MRHVRRAPVKPIEPGPGQESVWDYPRPPRVEPVTERVVVRLGGVAVAETREAFRVLETSHPPVYYLPRAAFVAGALDPAPGRSLCEFKGQASYLSVTGGGVTAERSAWTYREPWAGYEMLRDHVAVYPSAMESCEVGGEVVQAQEGDFYGGWITSKIVGPFKGAPGTLGW